MVEKVKVSSWAAPRRIPLISRTTYPKTELKISGLSNGSCSRNPDFGWLRPIPRCGSFMEFYGTPQKLGKGKKEKNLKPGIFHRIFSQRRSTPSCFTRILNLTTTKNAPTDKHRPANQSNRSPRVPDPRERRSGKRYRAERIYHESAEADVRRFGPRRCAPPRRAGGFEAAVHRL